MSLWKYKYFVDVIDSKSFTKAGKKNFVSQTAISQQISSLEKSVGGKLIDRGSGVIEPTELGRIVYTKAKEMLEINEEMLREIKRYKGRSKFELGVDCSLSRIFWKKVEKMLDVYYSETEADYHFHKVDSRTGCRMLEDGELDIFIGYEVNNLKLGDLEEEVLCKSKIGVFLGPRSTLKDREVLTLSDLEGHKRYETKLYSCSRQKGISQYTDKDEDEWVKCEDNVDTLKLKVEFNDGYAFVDSRFFSSDDGELRILEDFDKTCLVKFYFKKDRPEIRDVFMNLRELMGNDE